MRYEKVYLRCSNSQCTSDHLAPTYKLLTCARCQSVRYCSAACQKVMWPNHKLKCKTVLKIKKDGTMDADRVAAVIDFVGKGLPDENANTSS